MSEKNYAGWAAIALAAAALATVGVLIATEDGKPSPAQPLAPPERRAVATVTGEGVLSLNDCEGVHSVKLYNNAGDLAATGDLLVQPPYLCVFRFTAVGAK